MTDLSQQFDSDSIGVIIVDHGSRRAESNEMLMQVVELFKQNTNWSIIELAHMEIAKPTIADAFDRCVERGAKMVIVHPYFLLPGKHWHTDIPELTRQAATKHPQVKSLVTAPLGLHHLMATIMNDRITHCLACAKGEAKPCDLCLEQGVPACQFMGSFKT